MLFNSLHYLIFLPLVVVLYYGLPPRKRWPMLLVASYYFYMCWRPEYAILLLGQTLIDYVSGLLLARTERASARRGILLISILTNLGLLFVFKYCGFFTHTANSILTLAGADVSLPILDILLPVGISFHTFQSLSYTIDVYRRRVPVERNFGVFALYVSFFPQLVAGPIERADRLLPQLHRHHAFDPMRIENGLKLILWGFFKKLVIADRLAVYVDQVYGDPSAYGGGGLALATYFFAFQIYCDFSGYSDIAIGSARLLGYDLMQNFNRPYLAESIQEFWKRWHISLSTWFRDYVYLPLGGSHVRFGRWMANILIVFLVSGLWHGANWTFVAWGGVHGLLLILQRAFRDVFGLRTLGTSRFGRMVSVLITFHAVLLSWVFFRSKSLTDALYILGQILSLNWLRGLSVQDLAIPGFGLEQMLISAAVVSLLILVEQLKADDYHHLVVWRSRALRWGYYYALILATINFGMFHNPRQFIYFQF